MIPGDPDPSREVCSVCVRHGPGKRPVSGSARLPALCWPSFESGFPPGPRAPACRRPSRRSPWSRMPPPIPFPPVGAGTARPSPHQRISARAWAGCPASTTPAPPRERRQRPGADAHKRQSPSAPHVAAALSSPRVVRSSRQVPHRTPPGDRLHHTRVFTDIGTALSGDLVPDWPSKCRRRGAPR